MMSRLICVDYGKNRTLVKMEVAQNYGDRVTYSSFVLWFDFTHLPYRPLPGSNFDTLFG